MAAPHDVLDLVDRFHRHRSSYSQTAYKEAQVCAEFIIPMFEALGWDVYNRQGIAEAYKEVVHQHSLRTASGIEAPDYCFRIGCTPKFFLEAKKPAINVRTDISPAYQLRRYAWTAKLPLSILTDFEELAVYDTRIKPTMVDKASVARIQYLSFDQYPDRWGEIESIFSRDAIWKGSFDRFAEASTGKKGTNSVDADFLKEIETWRDEMARNLALRNKDLSVRELNFAVQRTIDRILFLRICEDRGIEDYGKLQSLLNGQNTYRRLFEVFEQADQRYNSGLFHFRKERERDVPDELTPGLSLDDKVLKGILGRLYYPESPYEFSIMPADVLGQVYEQFLGKVIRLTAGHQAKVEDKPEVKKAGGVYYTPTYIVDYIVKNTVGKLLDGCKAPKDAAKLRILDPACGSGSFLIVAYQTLLDWHLDWYSKNSPEELARKASSPVYQAQHLDPDGAPRWMLTTSEKKRILLNGIYGVDIDSQAVEVTKLSLMLKVLEGESEQTINTQMKLFHERALPDLSSNIKCGNSLIGPDFYDGRQLGMLDAEEMYRVNVFDWKRAYPGIMEAGGFDAVIGNPPYVRQESLGEDFKAYAKGHFKTYAGTADLYTYFIERSNDLLRDGGLFSFIVSNKWLKSNYGQALRAWMKDRGLEEIVDFGDLPVFRNATTYPCIVRMRKAAVQEDLLAVRMKSLDFSDLGERVRETGHRVARISLRDDGWSLADEAEQRLLDKMHAVGVPLGEYLESRVYRGVLTGLNEAFVIDSSKRDQLIAEDARSIEIIKPFLAGRDIKRYVRPSSGSYLLFTRRGIDIDAYPAIRNHLLQFKERLMPKPAGWKGEKWPGRKPGAYQWYEGQDTIDYWREFEKPKIIFPDISKSANFTYDGLSHYSVNTTYFMPTGDLALLALLNSKALSYYYTRRFAVYRGGYLRFFEQYLRELPISAADSTGMKRLSALAKQMLDLNAQLENAKTEYQSEAIRSTLEATDYQINQLVFQLYGLTDAEIAIVEEAGNA
ncbi:MAG: TaqI-like C-terminal specificity domain-containing protein [Methanotrichaceae archaeon]|nr:TaqI-like C-terminal specificity domain-containing protein [Methanotrichaceae archaeon]